MHQKEIERDREDVRDMKNISTTEGNGSKEEFFAQMIQEKNHERRQEYYISFIVYLLWMLGINLLLDYQLQDVGDRLGGMVLWIGMILWVTLFAERYYQCYFTLLGEHGEQPQNIIAVVRQFPFSVNDYGKYIRKQLRFWQGVIFCGTVAISGLGMLLFIRHDFFPVFLWETQDSGKVLLYRFLGILVVAVLMAMLPNWILQIKLAAVLRNHKGNSRRSSGTAREDDRKMEREKKWLLICLEVLFIIFMCILNMIIMEWIHPVSRNGILFVQIPSFWIFATILLMEFVRSWYRYLQSSQEDAYCQERIRQRRKMVAQLCIGILLFLLPQLYYDTYYENRMETRRFIYAKNYEWEDVGSYKVYCPVWGSDIQLTLYMKDGSQKKVFKSGVNYSEKYYSDYDSEYDYIKNMVEKLDALGVEGSLEDAKKIARKIDRKYIDEWEAWKSIREMMEE